MLYFTGEVVEDYDDLEEEEDDMEDEVVDLIPVELIETVVTPTSQLFQNLISKSAWVCYRDTITVHFQWVIQ